VDYQEPAETQKAPLGWDAEPEPEEPDYWAAKTDPEEIADEIKGRVREYYQGLSKTGLLSLWRSVHAAFYGLSDDGGHETSKIIEFGDDGEKLGARSNQMRSLVRYMLTSATADRPALMPKAINATAKALAQVPTARRVIEYYSRHKHQEQHLRGTALRALLYGKGYFWQTWDPTIGAVDQATGKRAGDIYSRACSPMEVACDLDRDTNDHDWFAIRRPRNRYDIAAVAASLNAADPARAEEIKDEILEGDQDCLEHELSRSVGFGLGSRYKERSDTIYEYHFMHRDTPALPGGRYVIIVGSGIVIFDGPLPFPSLPVSEMVPEEFLEAGSIGYASAWDLLGLQRVYDSLLSTCVSNLDAFGHNDVLLPDGVELGVEEIRDGLNVIRYPQGEANKPSMLEKFSIRAEAFQLRDWLKSDMELVTGVNSVARGEPEASLKSGAALALVQAQAIHFQSGLVGSYTFLLEDSGTKLIRILKEFATAPQIASISGSDDPDGLSAFSSKDLDMIDRIEVENVNPVFRTYAGRVDAADKLLERGLLQDASQYFQVMETGRLEPVTDPGRKEDLFVKSVEEALMRAPAVSQRPDPMTGEMVQFLPDMPVMITDHPVKMIKAAKKVADSPENRRNVGVMQACTVFIQEVLRVWRTAPKDLLNLLGIPLPPMLPGDAPDAAAPPVDVNTPSGAAAEASAGAAAPQPNAAPTPPGTQAGQEAPSEGDKTPSLPKPAEDPLKDQR